MFFAICSFFISEMLDLIFPINFLTASLNKKPPSKGIIGNTLKRAIARFNQNIQYNVLTIPLGVRAFIDADKRIFKIAERAVS